MSKLLKDKIRILYAVIVLVMALSVLTSGWVLYSLLNNIGEETVLGVQAVTALVDEQHQIQVIFRRQVQEWKDLLLRGDDETDFKRYHEGFQAEAGMVQNKMSHLANELAKQGLSTAHLQHLQQSHASLTRQYEELLQRFPLLGHPENITRLDLEVRGLDRRLSAEFDTLGGEIKDAALARISSVSDAVGLRYEMQEYYLYILLLVMLPGIGFVSVLILNRLTQKLVVEKERVQVTLSSIGDAVVVTDRLGCVEFLNPVAEQMTGWTSADAEGRTLQEVFHIVNETTRAVVQNPVEIVLREGRIVGLANHTVLIARDGSECAIEDSAAPVRDLDGTIRGVVLVFHDASTERQAADALRRQEALFRATFEQAAVGVAHVATDGRWLRVNQNLCAILGYSADELLKLTFSDITHPSDVGNDATLLFEMLAGKFDDHHVEKRYLHKDGSPVWVDLTLSLVRDETGSPEYFIAIIVDISARKLAEHEIQALRFQYQTLFDQMPDAVVLFNLEGKVTGYNQEALRQYEYTAEEMMNLRIPQFEAKESPEEYAEHKRNIEATGRDDFETQHCSKWGRIMDIQAAVRLVTLPDGMVVFQCAFRDITSQKQAQCRIEFLANHDHLTGLPNRRLLRDRMERAIGNAVRHGSGVALLFLDLDHFKVINDTLGHEVGDMLLQAVAERLRTCVREQDSIARIGGDEFVVILVEMPNTEAVASVARKIVDTLSVPYLAGGYDLHTTPSIGISLYPEDGGNFDALLQKADAAMYHAKENGRAGYRFFRDEMNVRTQERLAIEHDLHLALKREEFELYYQPKVDSRNGEIIGGEALIRWNHPEQGRVAPGQFISVAEQSNLINGIGEWVARAVCAQSRLWGDAGLKRVPISFNVSARQFLYSDLPVVLAQAIADTGADPTLLEMELTESVLMRPQEVQSALAAIKAMGFRIALDDFGTGYSSLAYLRKIEIDTIKINRSFVNDIEKSVDDVVIVQTLISTALNLHMEVIAEGVETEGQAMILCRSGCCACQGYFFGKPMPAIQFAELLRQS
ncbi:putative signaling protein [Ferriphaselus amnicola]|uniref:Putative signaling protein n=1 Tax=Ferriphaselus amnicola TaxID=1188319 RepID=A0A2Z6GA65_9PROT|nr:EAL domain-containing protein [Ferriphaselus amnicola]BBE50431.1 putative signaling protein [Ferriphaselus amnicola]